MKCDEATKGEWRVPFDLTVEEEEANGKVVVADNNLIADCRNDYLPESEQRANAQACARAKRMLFVLAQVEEYLGDKPSSDRTARNLHRSVTALLFDRVSNAPKLGG